jgi:hypothetical protein
VTFRHGLRKKGMNVTCRWNVEWLKRKRGDSCGQPLEYLVQGRNFFCFSFFAGVGPARVCGNANSRICSLMQLVFRY